jgi:hypothetical protein
MPGRRCPGVLPGVAVGRAGGVLLGSRARVPRLGRGPQRDIQFGQDEHRRAAAVLARTRAGFHRAVAGMAASAAQNMNWHGGRKNAVTGSPDRQPPSSGRSTPTAATTSNATPPPPAPKTALCLSSSPWTGSRTREPSTASDPPSPADQPPRSPRPRRAFSEGCGDAAGTWRVQRMRVRRRWCR